MPIITKRIVENTALDSGFRIKLVYGFNDGTETTLKCRGPLQSNANDYLVDKEQSVLKSKISSEIDEAIAANSDLPTEDMTKMQLFKAWMFKGFVSTDPVESYTYLVKVAQKVADLGLTAQQLADAFNVDVESINLVMARWQYLNTKKAQLLAYKDIKDGM